MDTFYFIVITIATVGYGDITPKSIPGQIVVILLIIGGITIIPALVQDFQGAIRLYEQGRETYTPGRNPFIVVCGKFDDPDRILDIAKNLFSKDREKSTTVVLLSKGKLSADLKFRVKNTQYKNRIFLIAGNGLDLSDLQRANLTRAASAVIIAELFKETSSKKIEDENNTVRAFAFTNFAPNVPIYVETLLTDTQCLQEDLGLRNSESICIHELSQIFLAYNCLYRGAATLMINLIRGSKQYSEYECFWHRQFADGMRSEIFRVELNHNFIGIGFHQLATYIYTEFQVILIGVHVYEQESENGHYISLNPTNYQMKMGDYLFLVANSFDDIIELLHLKSVEMKAPSLKTCATPTKAVSFLSNFSHPSLPALNSIPPKDYYKNGYPDLDNIDKRTSKQSLRQ